MSAVAMLRRWVFPPLCPVTGEVVDADGALSPAAWADLGFLLTGPRCRACGREVPGAPETDTGLLCNACVSRPRAWGRGLAAVRYEGSGRRIVLALKHGDRLDLAPLLAGWMLRARPALVREAEVIAPVPLHWRRLLARRANQSAEIARALARAAGKPGAFAPRLLARTRSTVSQDGLNRQERAANLEGAIAPGAEARRLRGRRVLLVDDVMTTGATLEACARVCLGSGARSVDVAVAALVSFDGRPYLPDDREDTQDEE